MRIEGVKEKIQEAVSYVARFSGKHPTLPVLNTVFCEAKGTFLILRATNLDIGIQIKIPVKVITEGSVAIPTQTLSTLLSTIQTKQIDFEEKNGNIIISSGSYKTIIKCLPKEDFPTLPIVSDGEKIVMEGEKLSSGIESVAYSASVSEIKPELSSVYIHPEQNTIVFVSTDSFRLAEKKIQIKGIKDFNGIIIPYKNAIEIARVFKGTNKEITVLFSKHHISLSSDNIHITSRLIDGTFPDYKQIIPKEEKTRVVALKEDVVQSIKITNVFANKFNQVTLKVKPKEKLFIMESKNSDIGESSVSVDAALSGEDVELNVNHRYFADCIPFIHQDSVALSFNGPGKPIIVQGASDTSFTYLVMPMNR